MDTKIIYAAVASSQSLDSWDIDNLKYIRKISRHSGQDLDPASYIDEHENEEEKENESEAEIKPYHIQQNIQSKHGRVSVSKPHLPAFDTDVVTITNTKKNTQNIRDKFNNINLSQHSGRNGADIGMKNGQMVMRRAIIEPTVEILTSDGAGGLRPTGKTSVNVNKNRPPLDDCYLLDVVTVRNESVLAFTSNYPAIGIGVDDNNNNKNDSAGSASSPSSASSSISVGLSELQIIDSDSNSTHKGRDFFDLSLNDEEYQCESSRRHFYFNSYGKTDDCSQGSRSPTIVTRDNHRRNPSTRPAAGPCPFCDHNNPFLNAEHLEDLSMQATMGEPEPHPRSPSPYYVRLRRDLLTAITPPPHHPRATRPRNFSVNGHGQLAIDYTNNWKNLEIYMKNLKRP